MQPELNRNNPPYRAAAIVVVVVLIVYLLTLAPSVTFWDAGELIAAAHELGIPHPPGSPLYVIMAHVWGMLVPAGDYAWRINLMSAVAGALAAGCWFLVAVELADRADAGATIGIRLGAGFAAALLVAFNYSTWRNMVEAEVYSVALLMIAVVAWLTMRWSRLRRAGKGERHLLAIIFIWALAVGNHLLALLTGPAVLAFMVAESLRAPLDAAHERRAEHSRLAIIAAAWLLLVALGLGSTALLVVASVPLLVALALAVVRRQGVFMATGLALLLLGISPYLFLLIRARQGPPINEADPGTLDALIAVIRRAQYPVRTPLDDPTVAHGLGNPGRSLRLIGIQLANFGQYFDWQWARQLGHGVVTTWQRMTVTVLALSLGLRGLGMQWRRDRAGMWFTLILVLVTGLGLVAYMNFKPGPSIGWNIWPGSTQHEVRERDYFFVASFVGWGVLMAMGLVDIVVRTGPKRWRTGWFAVAAIPLVLNFGAASRRNGADRTLARDFSRALLNSVPPGGILFTWGDNDTFPLWHAQLVDGVRPDVTVVCLALATTRWYQRQLRDQAGGAVDRAALPAVWRLTPSPTWHGPLHAMSDAMIDGFTTQRAARELELPLRGGGRLVIQRGTVIGPREALLLAVVEQNAGRRPIAWSLTAAQALYQAPVVEAGLALVLPVDSSARPAPESIDPAAERFPLNVGATTTLIEADWRFGKLLTGRIDRLDPNIAAIARTIAVPYVQLGLALLQGGDTTAAAARLGIASHLAPTDAGLARLLQSLDRPR